MSPARIAARRLASAVFFALVAAFCAPTAAAQLDGVAAAAVAAADAASKDLMDATPDSVAAPASRPAAGEKSGGLEDDLSQPLKVVLVLTVLAVAPAILMTATSFTRILIVLSFVRRAISVPELPPNQVLIGLSLFLTCVVMRPVMDEVYEQALNPYLAEEIPLKVAADRASVALKKFLLDHVRDEDVRLFLELTETEAPETRAEVPLTVLVPAFAMSELRTAFQMGFLVYLPFLILDLVVSSILLSMGMFMLPPVVISTPFKILLFILTDGWELVTASIVRSFQRGGAP
jgi:flagellar biosynthetic protein FliP